MGWGYYSGYPEYVPVRDRISAAKREAAKLAKRGETLEPVTIEGRKIALTFWGKSWCDNLESYSDYANRLPRGRSYLANGLVIDLKVTPGRVKARVYGTALYTIDIEVAKLPAPRWTALRAACAGRIDSLVELLQGRLADDVMRQVCDRATGLFPGPLEIKLRCSCPDGASMCKHVAAALYGVGARLDRRPELLFVLRGVDHLSLVEGATRPLAVATPGSDALAGTDLGELFGIELAATLAPAPARPSRAPRAKAPKTPPPKAPPVRAARVKRADTFLFRPGERVDTSDLAAIGIPAAVYRKWVTARALVRTAERGVYLATRQLNEMVLDQLTRA